MIAELLVFNDSDPLKLQALDPIVANGMVPASPSGFPRRGSRPSQRAGDLVVVWRRRSHQVLHEVVPGAPNKIGFVQAVAHPNSRRDPQRGLHLWRMEATAIGIDTWALRNPEE